MERYLQAMQEWCAARYRLEMGRGDFDEECAARECLDAARKALQSVEKANG